MIIVERNCLAEIDADTETFSYFHYVIWRLEGGYLVPVIGTTITETRSQRDGGSSSGQLPQMMLAGFG